MGFLPNPSYNIIGNNIHIYIDLNDKNIDKEIVELKREVNDQYKKRGANRITKQEIVNVIYSNTKTIFHKEPTVLFSLNELTAFLYELLINEKSGEELEKIISQKVISRFNTIKNYDTKQQLSNSFIPKKLNKGKTHRILQMLKNFLGQ